MGRAGYSGDEEVGHDLRPRALVTGGEDRIGVTGKSRVHRDPLCHRQ